VSDVLAQLKAGIRKFRTEVYPKNKQTYLQAVREPQRPHALFITCAEMLGGVSAVVEYAVTGLKVQHVVICGHSDCGAMKALVRPESLEEMPAVKNWMNNAAAAMSVTKSMMRQDERPSEFVKRLTDENVLLQLQHLRTHPSVAGAMARGELTISGWVYDIGKGEVKISEDGGREFHPVRLEGESA
jgi:carbonic anhydrase